MNCDDGVGSSSVLRRMFWTTGCSSSASSKMKTRRRPSNGRYDGGRDLLADRIGLLLTRRRDAGNRHDVGMRAAGDAPARRAGTAGVVGVRRGGQAVEPLRHGQRHQAFADAVRADEDETLRQRLAPQGTGQQRLLGLVALEIAERHGYRGSSGLSSGRSAAGGFLREPKIRPQKPRFFFGSSGSSALRVSAVPGATLPEAGGASTPRSGSGDAASETACDGPPPPNSPPSRVSRPAPVCSGHSS